jgi:hypothetical protein
VTASGSQECATPPNAGPTLPYLGHVQCTFVPSGGFAAAWTEELDGPPPAWTVVEHEGRSYVVVGVPIFTGWQDGTYAAASIRVLPPDMPA